MAQDFLFANFDRRELFDVGLRTSSSSSSSAGRGWGARGLALLLWDGAGNSPDFLCGRWARQRVSAISDFRIEDEPEPYQTSSGWTDITGDVLLLLWRVDRVDLLAEISADLSNIGTALAALALEHKQDHIKRALSVHLDDGWESTYWKAPHPGIPSPVLKTP